MWYAVAAIVLSLVTLIIWLGYKAYHAGQDRKENESLKAGAKQRERQDEAFEKYRGHLSDRIAGRMRDNPGG